MRARRLGHLAGAPFAIGALLMAFDFVLELGPTFPQLAGRIAARHGITPVE